VSAESLQKCSGFIPLSASVFLAKFHEKRPLTVQEMLINLKNMLFRNGEGSGNVIPNRYPGSDHHQRLVDSSKS